MPRPKPISDRQETQMIALYQTGVSRNRLADVFGASRRFVTDCLKRNNIHVRNINEGCPGLPIRHDAFTFAETDEQAAYWVGFLMADGCVSASRGTLAPHVILVLSAKDIGHVESFRSFLKSSHNIQTIKPQSEGFANSGVCARLDFASRQMVSDLARYGVVPRKSKTAKVIGLENSSDFWRGVIDGDGSLHVQPRGKHKPRPVIQLCGSLPLIGQFCSFAHSLTGTKVEPHKDKSIWASSLYCSHAVRIIRHLYGNCTVALPRKLAIAKEIMATF